MTSPVSGRFTTVAKSTSYELTIPSGGVLSNTVDLRSEYTSFKVALVSAVGLHGSTVFSLQSGTNTIYLSSGAAASLTHPGTPFVWSVHVGVGVQNVRLALTHATTDDVILQITGYGRVE